MGQAERNIIYGDKHTEHFNVWNTLLTKLYAFDSQSLITDKKTRQQYLQQISHYLIWVASNTKEAYSLSKTYYYCSIKFKRYIPEVLLNGTSGFFLQDISPLTQTAIYLSLPLMDDWRYSKTTRNTLAYSAHCSQSPEA